MTFQNLRLNPIGSQTRNALIAAVAMILTACQTVPVEDAAFVDAKPDATATIEPRQSPNDQRSYRYLTLSNKLQVLLVSDPATDKSAAALSVYRGSFHDPDERLGLAHFLEHMLFIGTAKYPQVDTFQQYITANGGSSNAYTAADHTNYFFDVKNSALNEGIDRFAHFFIDPLLSAEYVEREKNAVHSEYQMQIKDDGWRGYMVSKLALNPEHPGHRFTIGSLDTLAGDVKADLDRWFDANYSADQMGLVVLSDRSLDDLQALVTPLFTQIPNKDIGPSYPTAPVFAPGQLPARLTSQSLKDRGRLAVSFPIPNTLTTYRTKPEQYVSNLLGHEGEGSLHSALTAQGWIESLGVGAQDFDHATSLLSVEIQLTTLGQQHVDDVLGLLFAQLAQLRAAEPERWRYQEQAQVAELGFQFQEPGSTLGFVYQMAPRLKDYPAEDLLVAPYLMEGFEPKLIADLLARLTPENAFVEFATPDFESAQTEPWFNVAYELTRGPHPVTASPDAKLTLPAANPYLPEDLSLLDRDDQPITLAVDQPGLQLWLDTDVSFTTPRANIALDLLVPGGFSSLRDSSLSQLFVKLINDELTQPTYPALLAGLNANLAATSGGIAIRIGGYNDKQPEFGAFILDQVLTASLSQERFATLKRSLIRSLQNTTKDKPYNQALTRLETTLLSTRWPATEQAAVLEQTTLEELRAWRQETFTELAVVGGLHGNVNLEDANRLAELLNTVLPISRQERARPEVLQLNHSMNIDLAVDHNDATLLIYAQDADASFTSRAKSALAGQLLRSPFFSDLRTEQQLGYVVSAGIRRMDTQSGNLFLVQSPNADVAYLEQAVITFLQDYVDNWDTLSDEFFEQQKNGLIARLTEQDKNLSQRSQRYWQSLAEENYDFDSNQQIADIVTALTKADMGGFLQDLLRRVENRRVKIYSQGAFAQSEANPDA
jgi:insulysin